MQSEPISNGQLAVRDKQGRFIVGHKGLPGAGFAPGGNVQKFRKRLFEAVSDEDFDAAVAALVAAAKRGKPWALKELLDRLVGQPSDAEAALRMEALEGVLQRLTGEAP